MARTKLLVLDNAVRNNTGFQELFKSSFKQLDTVLFCLVLTHTDGCIGKTCSLFHDLLLSESKVSLPTYQPKVKTLDSFLTRLKSRTPVDNHKEAMRCVHLTMHLLWVINNSCDNESGREDSLLPASNNAFCDIVDPIDNLCVCCLAPMGGWASA